MKYVTFEIESKNIVTASGGPIESHIQNLPQGCGVADCGTFVLEGPLVNYMFAPDGSASDGPCVTGSVIRKPQEKWDMQQENLHASMNARILKFHQLDYSTIKKFELAVNCVDILRKLPNGEYQVVEGNDKLTLSIRKKECNSVPFEFDVGNGGSIGGAFPFGYMEVKFDVDANFECVREACGSFVDDHGKDFSVFLDRVIYSSLIKLCLRVCNKLIEAYRIAFDDPEARAVGMGDVLSSVMFITLLDGDRHNYSMGSPYRTGSHLTDNLGAVDECVQKMRSLLENPIAFIPSAIGLLKMAHFYGQYRECVVWSATIMSTVIEKMLTSSLPEDSDEYRKLKNNGKAVSGKEKRKNYFKLAYGVTLTEYLAKIVSNYQGGNQGAYWNHLPQLVEKVLGDRNLLLHRKKAISSKESDDAFYTCMNFIYALEGQVPYSTIYSRDFHLKMLDYIL